jgi:hypothetical protein
MRGGPPIWGVGQGATIPHLKEPACYIRKPEGKITLRRSRHRWEDNIKMDLKGIGLEMWIGLI